MFFSKTLIKYFFGKFVTKSTYILVTFNLLKEKIFNSNKIYSKYTLSFNKNKCLKYRIVYYLITYDNIL